MEKNILFRTVIEVAGRPQAHVQNALAEYLDSLKKDLQFTIVHQETAEVQKQDQQEIWATFAELEIKTNSVQNLISFCFDFMPSSVEILEPDELVLPCQSLTSLFNDLQARLHQVDLIAKQLRLENDHLQRNTQDLLKNYIIVLLRSQNLDSAQLSKFTGVNKDQLEDFLDQLIDEGKIDMKEGVYYFREESIKH